LRVSRQQFTPSADTDGAGLDSHLAVLSLEHSRVVYWSDFVFYVLRSEG
jgi:hypothetical protein